MKLSQRIEILEFRLAGGDVDSAEFLSQVYAAVDADVKARIEAADIKRREVERQARCPFVVTKVGGGKVLQTLYFEDESEMDDAYHEWIQPLAGFQQVTTIMGTLSVSANGPLGREVWIREEREVDSRKTMDDLEDRDKCDCNGCM